mmetsp:Transcript_34493/g.40335  ORF Transcript_34493/g.40335 Transcript_34493/m.40335 type:complete len:323 (-) Transcript_34493:75-1043(-)
MASKLSPELNLAKRYLSLVQDFKNRPVVARRNTIPSLLKLLKSTDVDVRLVAAETIALLAEHPDNPQFLCKEKEFLRTVYEAYHDSEVDELFHSLLSRVFDALRVCLDENESEQARTDEHIDPAVVESRPEPTSSNAPPVDGAESARIAKGRTTRILKSVGRCRTLTLQVWLATEQRGNTLSPRVSSDLQELLHTTRGVVSFSIDSTEAKVTMFASTALLTLKQLLRDGGYECDVIGEVKLESSSVNADTNSSSNRSAPRYLDSIKSFASSLYQNSLVLHGTDANTLASRLKQQKEEARRKRNQKEVSQVHSFLTKLTAGWW